MDPALLRATAIATNKSCICDFIYKGLAAVGVGLISPVWPQYYWSPPHNVNSTFNLTRADGSVWSYTKPLDEVMEFDVALANQILNESGYIYTDSTHTLRKIGPDAATRLENLNLSSYSVALGQTLEFEDDVDWDVFKAHVESIQNVEKVLVPKKLSKFQVLAKARNVEQVKSK